MKKILVATLVVISLTCLRRIGAEPALTAVPGYRVCPVLTVAGDPVAYSAGIHAFDRDGSGELYIFSDNQIIRDPAGSAQVLFNYQTTAVIYGSFIRAQGGTIYFGESSEGTVRSVPAAGGGSARLFAIPNFRAVPPRLRAGLDFNLPGNFACSFNSLSEMFLSANPGGWSPENKIYHWDGQTDPVIVADLGGYSGPIAFDREDNLYYGDGDGNVAYFKADQVADAISTGVPLTTSDWTVLTQVDPCSGFAFDRNISQNLYSSSYYGTLTRIGASGETSAIAAGSYPSNLSFTAGTGDFAPFSPGTGRLSVLDTDYSDYSSTVFDLQPVERSFLAIFRPSSGLWAVRGATRAYFGREDDEPSPGDFDGDGLTDIALFRPSSGLWAARGVTRAYFGGAGDVPSPDDFDGNGTDDIAVFRPSSGLWAVRGATRAYFGGAGDVPSPDDFDGNGTDDIAVFRPSSGLWAARGVTRFYFGGSGDDPLPGDFNGDGTAGAGIFRPAGGLWALRGVSRSYFGVGTDTPLALNANPSTACDIGIFRPESGLWAIRGFTRFYFGTDADIPVVR